MTAKGCGWCAHNGHELVKRTLDKPLNPAPCRIQRLEPLPMTSEPTQPKSKRTLAIHAGSRRSQFGEVSEALYLTQGYVYEDAATAEARFKGEGPPDQHVYARYGNPTVAMFQDRLAAFEGAEACFATASGMAAVNAAMFGLLQAGDHVVAARALFGSCRYIIETLLPKFGVETTLIDGRDLAAWQSAIKPNTKLFFLESPSNPTLEIIDIAAVATIAKAHDALLVVDNVFATPCFQSPLALGADLVMYSTTKHIDGQGRMLGGALLGSEELISGPIKTYLKHTGATMNPFTAWVMLKGLETLDLRVREQTRTAAILADALADMPKVARVLYPHRADHPQYTLAKQQMAGGGTVVAFEVAGGKAEAFAAIDRLRLIIISNNLGDSKTLITHPATTTHKSLTEEQRAELGIGDGLLRLSVGLETSVDLTDDLAQALV